jgi:hypothetical protein
MVRRLSASMATMAAGSGAPLAKPRAPAWALVFGDPSGMIDLAQAAAHRLGCTEDSAQKLNSNKKIFFFFQNYFIN